MATTETTKAPFNRDPYIFEKTEPDELGNLVTSVYYSAAGRKEEFRHYHPEGRIITEPVEIRNAFAIFKCSVYLNGTDTVPYRTAFASRELNPETDVGRRFIECAETAAIGRALANAGIGADAYLDILDQQERAETGGTPIKAGKAGPKDAQAEQPKDAKADENQTENASQAGVDTTGMTEAEIHSKALNTKIVSTSSRTLKGKTFAQAITIAKDPAKFKEFLNGLITGDATPEEKFAAPIVLKQVTAKKDEAK